MARFPTRDDLGAMPSARVGGPMARIKTSVAETSAVGRGAESLGRQISGAGATLHSIAAKFEQADEFETERRFQEFKWSEAQRLDETMRSTEPGRARDLPETFTGSYSENAKGFFETVPDHLKPKYDERLFDVERQFYGNATQFSREEQKRYATQSMAEHKKRLAIADNLDEAKADYKRLIDINPDLTPIDKDEVLKRDLEEIEEANIEHRLNRGDDPWEVYQELERSVGKEEEPSGPIEIKPLTNSGIRGFQRKSAPQGVVVHHTAGTSLEGAISWGAKKGTGTNYYIDTDGTIVQALPDEMGTVHIRNAGSRFRTNPELGHLSNDNTIGIEIVARSNKDITPKQRQAAMALLGRLQKSHGLPAESIVGHGELQGGKGGNREVDEGAVAKEFREGGSRMVTTSASGVERSELPPVSERGLTQYAGLKNKDTATDATEGAAPDENATLPSRYSNLSPKRRQALIYKAKTALSAKVQGVLDDDVESIRRTGAPVAKDADIAKAKAVLTPNQFQKYQMERDGAEAEFEAGRNLEFMSAREMDEHMAGLVPKPGSPDYAMRSNVYVKTDRKVRAIRELRENDPALSVNEAPEVTAVARQFKPEDPQYTQAAIRGRLEAQDRLGISPYDQRTITKAEAKALLNMGSAESMTEREKMEALRAAAERAESQYGPYARRALEDAFRFYVRDSFGKEFATGLIAKMARGETPSKRDLRQADEMNSIESADRMFKKYAEPAGPPMPGSTKASTPRRKASPAAVEFLISNPDRASEFDAKYGAGAAAEVLSKVNK